MEYEREMKSLYADAVFCSRDSLVRPSGPRVDGNLCVDFTCSSYSTTIVAVVYVGIAV